MAGNGIIVKVGTEYDGKDLARAQREIDKLNAAIKPAGAGFTKVGKQLQDMGAKMSAFGSTLTRNVTLPLAAVGAAAVVAVDKASDLAETISKVGVLFGKSAGEVEAWSKTAATSLGQSQQQALDAASTFAIFGQSAGLSGGKLVDFSTNLTSLAADLASFNNTSPQDAIDAIGAALRGESEPLRRYGVLLDDATLKAAAMEMGIYKGTGTLTAQQKVLAANKVIFEQTTAAQGDFARTSGGLANQTRILKAQMEDVTAQIGTALLPIALEMVGIFRDQVVPVIQNLADRFSQLSPETIKMGAGLGLVAAAAGPALMVLGHMTSGIGSLVAGLGPLIGALGGGAGLTGVLGTLIGPVGIVIAAIVGLIAIFVAMWRESEVFRNAIMQAWDAISAAIGEAVGTIQQALADNADSINTLKAAFQMLGDVIGTYVVPIIRDYIVVYIKMVVAVIAILINYVARLIDAWRIFASGAVKAVAVVVRAYGTAVSTILGFYADLTQRAADAFGWVPGIGEKLQTAANAFRDWSQSSGAAVDEVANRVWQMGEAIDASTQPRTVVITVEQRLATEAQRWARGKTASDFPTTRSGATGGMSAPAVTKAKSTGSTATKADPFAEFVKGIRESVGKLKAKARLMARGVPEALADSIVGADGWKRITSRLLKGGKDALANFVRLWTQSAEGKSAVKSQIDSIVQAAKDGLQKLKDLANDYVSQVRAFGSATSLGSDAPISAASITANLQQRLGIVRQFIAAMGQLKALGLDGTVRADIFSMGPFDGLKYAQALLAGGKQAIGEVNALTAQFNSPAVAGRYAMLGLDAQQSSTANYVPPQSVTVAAGGINITVNGEVTAQTRADIRQAVVDALNGIGREAKSSKKAGVR